MARLPDGWFGSQVVCHVRARRLSRDSRVKSVRHENAFQIPREASQLRLSASEVPRPPLPVLDDSQQCRLDSLDNASVRAAVTLARLHVATNLPNTDPRPTRRAIGTPASWIRRASSARFCGKRVPGQGGEPQFQRSAPLLDGVYGVRNLPADRGSPEAIPPAGSSAESRNRQASSLSNLAADGFARICSDC